MQDTETDEEFLSEVGHTVTYLSAPSTSLKARVFYYASNLQFGISGSFEVANTKLFIMEVIHVVVALSAWLRKR